MPSNRITYAKQININTNLTGSRKQEKVGQKISVNECIADLENTNPAVRIDAMDKLLILGRDAVPEMISYVKKSDGNARTRSILVLGRIANAEDGKEFVNLLNNESRPLDSRSRAAMIGALGKIDGRSYLELFRRELIKATNEDVQCAAAVALADCGDNSGTEFFIRYLGKREERKIRWAVKYLQKLYKEDLGTNPERWRAWLKEHSINILQIERIEQR